MTSRRFAPSAGITRTLAPGWARDSRLLLVAAVALAWAGLVLHNVADLPGQTAMSPESLGPTVVWMVALVLWVTPRTRRAGLWVLLAWGAVNLVGGALSVLPLPVLPFAPEQSVRHYAFHGIYAATQIPIILLVAAGLRSHAESMSVTGPRSAPVRALQREGLPRAGQLRGPSEAVRRPSVDDT